MSAIGIASLIVGIVGVLAGAGQTIAGTVENVKAKKNQQEALAKREAEYNKELKTSYLDTPEARSVLETAKDNYREQSARGESIASLTGQTNEAKLAARKVANKDYSDTIRKVASGANAYKNSIHNRYSDVFGSKMKQYGEDAQSGNNMVGSGINTAMAGGSTMSEFWRPDAGKTVTNTQSGQLV